MVRPILPKLNPTPRVDPKANAAQIAQLEAQAAQLREQIRLANKMGEREWAATARQELTQVTGKLDALQQPAATPVNASAGTPATGTPANGTGVQPALYTQPTTLAFAPVKLNTGTPEKDPAADKTAHSIIDDVKKGKSIEKIASERGMTNEQVLAAIRAGNNLEVTVTDPTSNNGDVRTTVIKDTSDPKNQKTVTLYYDYQHDTYYAAVQDGSAAPTETPLRDGLGRKQTSSHDSETGAITTRYEDDLGSGTTTERTSMPNGASVETVTPKGGPALPVTTVTGPDGKKTVLAPTQDPGGTTTKGIQDDLAAGKSIDQIAKERGLTKEQVIAELQGAGYQVKTGDPKSDNGDVQSVELVDPHSGDKTSYYYDYQHDTRTVVTTKGDTETTASVDGNGKTTNTTRNTKTGEATTTIVDPKAGTEIKIVTDKDGRVTKTTTEKINDGKPIDYEVKLGNNLTLIAQQHGVTLDELRKTNPELFDNPRDPNLIHPGEKVRIENGTRTTVEVTANGYTLTTKPDGSVTLHNNTTGANLDIKVGTAQEALATLLVSINPKSKDPETAKADTVLKTTLEGILGGASPDLLKDVTNKQQAVKDAIATYGGGKPATPQLDGSTTTVGPFGAPPKESTKSGGNWVPLMVDGSWQWFDPEVAKAIAAENAAVARLGEAQAKPVQSQAQLDVYALDPAYKGAMTAAKSTLDKALAPYGLEWKAPTPKGTLAEAQERLTLANDALEKATTARVEYTQGEKDLLAAIGKQATLPAISDPSKPAAGQSGGPSNMEINLDAKAKHSEVSNLFIQSSLHTANGNKATVDQMVSATELELKLTDAKPESPEHKALTDRLEGLKTLQKAAGNQVALAEAYAEYGVAQKDAMDLAVRVEPIKQQIIAQARQRNPHHFDENGYTNGEGDYTGKLLKQEFIEENGQLYMVNTYENDNFLDENNNDTNVLKVQLTYDLNNKDIRDDFRNNSLNKQWQDVMSSTRSTPTSAPVCTPGGTGSISALEAAKSKIIGTQVGQLDAGLKDAKTKLINADTALEKAITDHGGGTIEAPAGTLKPGEQPVKITVNGRDVWVAPEVAAAYGKQGPSAIGDSGKAVQIEMNGQKLWVHPEVAAAEIDRGRAEDEKNQLEKWETEARPAMVAARDWYSFSAGHPKLLDDSGMGERESKLKNEYFQEHRDKALAGYQVQFENLYDKGFTGEYKQYKGGELTDAVAKTLGRDPSSEGVENVTDEIRDRAGDNAQVKVVPIFSLDGGMESMTALFAIKDGGGKEVGYVDSSGKYYGSFDEFQHENRIFSDKGKLVMAKGGDMSLGADGKFTLDELEVADGRKVDFWDKATDIGLGIVAGAATIVSFIPGGQWAIPIAIASGAALGGKTLYKEGEHLLQGGEFDSQSAWNIATGVVSFLPVGAGSLRTIGLAKSGASLSTFQAFKGGFGMTRMADASWGIGKFKVNVSQSSYAGEVSSVMQSGGRLNTAAWGLDAAGLATGVPILMRSAEDLALHGGEMSFAELANAIMGIGTGAVGTGLGGRGLVHNMPGAPGPRGGDGPSSNDGPPTDTPPPPPAGEAGSEPWPRHVYEAGADGVYRPTGRYVMPSPDEIVIQGEVVGEEPGGSGTNFGTRNGPEGTNPMGQRALPAGTGHGPEQTPPTGGKGDPSGDGQSPDVTSTRTGSGPVKVNAGKPADSDPIIVPDKPVTGDDPVRLVWNPETNTFSGMPERDTSGYTYSSGKDERTPSAYLDGLTNEQLLQRYETEKSYYSSREMAERYGPDGVQLARTPLRESLPDFRVGVTFRVRLNTGQAFDIGSPTIAAVGFGIGTKTDFGAIGWSIVDSFSQRSVTPFKDALSTQGVVSYRAREYRNITALQAGVWPVSEQTALPVRASDLSGKASEGIFNEKAGYEARPLNATIAGKTPDGVGTVIEMTYSPSLKGTAVTLAPGQHDFFGVPAENKAGHVRLEGALPFDRVMTETKAGLRLPIVANHVDAVDALPRVGVEMRPELPVKDTLKPGDVVSRQTYDQIQSGLGSTVLKVQFVVKDPVKAADLVIAIGEGNGIQSIRDLVKAGQIDPANTVSYADEPTTSGLRLSAVPGKTPSADIVLLTGEKVRVLNPEALLVDIIFNDRNGLPGVLGTNPDKIATSLTYKVKSTVKSWLPARFQPEGTPQPRYMPGAGNIYKNLYGADGTPATRYTASLSTPPLPAGAFAYSAEVRVQFKSKAPSAARSIAKNETAQVTFKTADGQSADLSVPAWIARAVEPSRDGAATGIPKGAKKSLAQFLDKLETTARPDQLAAIAQFRSEFGASIVDGGFMRQNVADGLMTLLSSQVGRRNSGPMQIRDENGQFITATRFGPLPKSAESVYVPPPDGPQARGDEPGLMHKSHIFFRDPETGEAYVLPWTRGASEEHVPGSLGKPDDGAGPVGEKGTETAPVRKALEAAPPTTFSLQQIRNMRQPEKWKAGEVYTRELNGSLGEVHFPVAANPNGPHPVTGEGGRYVDAPVFKSQGEIEAIEVKTYHRWITTDGVAQAREVPLTPKLQEQVNKDVALRNENPGYQPRWVFLDAPPSAELQGALDQAGIVGNIFGHNKPTAVKASRTIELRDKDGEAIVAAMLGTEPRGPEQVYIPPVDGPRLAADAPETATKTHILVRDPDSGAPVVVPWIRGASEYPMLGGAQPLAAPGPRPRQGTGTGLPWGTPSAKPLSGTEIAANRQEALTLLGEVLPQNIGMKEVTRAGLADQISRSPTLMSLLRSAQAEGVRIVNPARSDLRIVDAHSGDDVTAVGSQYRDDVRLISVDAETFRAPDADGDTVLADFVDMLAHELSHVSDIPIDLRPENFANGQAFRDAAVDAYMRPEGKAMFAQYTVADELAVNGGKPASFLSDQQNQIAADAFASYVANEISVGQAVDKMAALHRAKSPSTSDGTYEQFYGRYADTTYQQYQAAHGLEGLAPGARVLVVGYDGPVLRNTSDLNITSLSPHGRGISALRSGKAFDRIVVGTDVLPQGGSADQTMIPLKVLSDRLKPGGQVHLMGVGDQNVLNEAVAGVPGLTVTRAANETGSYFRLTKDGTGQTGQVPLHAGRPHAPAPANKGQPASSNGPLTRDGVRAVPLDQVRNLDIGDFQPAQIPWLKREQVAEFTEQQFHDLDQAGLLPYLTKSQLRGIPKSKAGFLNIAGLDAKQIPWVTKGQVGNMTGQQFVDLGSAGLTRHLIEPQVQAIKGDKIEFVDVSTLEGRQIPWFKPGQVAKFTSPQFESLGKTGLFKNLGERQVPAIPETMISSLDMTKFDPKQVPWLTGRQIPALTREQWGDFTIHHTEALTQPHIEAVTPKQFEEMSPGQFRKFTLEQFEWMGVDQTNGLSVLQLTTFRATHRKSMTPDQRVLVDGALAYARTREYQAALDTFGAMAGTSYTLWSTLPPTWSATAGAVSFGVRGLVFGAQAIFPNATAAHKPFGRFLNALGGATFIAAAPGAATGVVQGKDLIVNSTFTLGNMVYGTKSMLQSFTGRPVIRNLAEYLAGPGYVLGCAVYTVNSWPAPIATVAGAMFTFGCAEFWASAIRTDRVNSRSVPRTEADIAAAEKSDKKWAAWDRWTLGITFGVGMLLFSLDALLSEPWKAAKPAPVPDPKDTDDKTGTDGTQPDEGTDKPDPGEKKLPETFPQLVVLADDGLNLRTEPGSGATVVTVLQPGTFVEQTAKPSTDSSGKAWLPVKGYGPDGKMHSGWVSADLVTAHKDGASNGDGRINPKLEQGGYRWVEVKNGDSIRLIATTNSADVADTVVLNMDHIVSPDVIFAGDRIYLPTVAVG